MDFSVLNDENRTEVHLSGRMTFIDHEKFRSVIAVFDGPEGHQMTFDLSRLDFVDSSGLGMLIVARDTARRRGLEFCLRGARGDVKRLMTAAKFQKMFTLED